MMRILNEFESKLLKAFADGPFTEAEIIALGAKLGAEAFKTPRAQGDAEASTIRACSRLVKSGKIRQAPAQDDRLVRFELVPEEVPEDDED